MQQSENLERGNRVLEQLVEILKGPAVTTFQDGNYTNDICECAMALLLLNFSIDKIDQVIKVVLS